MLQQTSANAMILDLGIDGQDADPAHLRTARYEDTAEYSTLVLGHKGVESGRIQYVAQQSFCGRWVWKIRGKIVALGDVLECFIHDLPAGLNVPHLNRS